MQVRVGSVLIVPLVLGFIKEVSSTEDQMEVLYESLQAEAKKIQQFKVHALAQIKQKVQPQIF